MFLPRIIPLLLLKNNSLIKTKKFKESKYIGDPINAVKLFNDLLADELIFIDLDASYVRKEISYDIIEKICGEAFMPIAIGGGIKKMNQIEKLIKIGSEKVVINSSVVKNMIFIKEISESFGTQSLIISIDIKKKYLGKYSVWIENGKKDTKINPTEYAKRVEEHGAGEIIIHSIEHDGMMNGYDLKITKEVSNSVNIPVIACGGAGNYEHLKSAYFVSNANALAAGSMFVFHGQRKAVLINYPSRKEKEEIFKI